MSHIRLYVLPAALAVLIVGPPPRAADPAPAADTLGDPLPAGAVARLGTTRLSHSGTQFLAFSPDGSKLATAGDGWLRVWDVSKGKLVREWSIPRFASLTSYHRPLTFTPDGRRLVLAIDGPDPDIRVWDVDTGKDVARWPGPKDERSVTVVTIAPDGNALAAGRGKVVAVHDFKTGKEVRAFDGRYTFAFHVAFAADGKTLTAVGWAGGNKRALQVHRWETDTGKEVDSHTVESSTFFSQLSPDGRFLALPDRSGTAIRIWDVVAGRDAAVARESDHPSFLAFEADGKTFTAASRDGKMRVWETASGKLLHRLVGEAGAIDRVALSADARVVAGVFRGDIHLWDVRNARELHAFGGHRSGPIVVAFAPDGRSVLTANRDPGYSTPAWRSAGWSLIRWDAATGRQTHARPFTADTEVRYSTFSPDGAFLAVALNSGRLRLYDTATGKEAGGWDLPTRTFTVKGPVADVKHQILSDSDLAFTDDGTTVTAAGSEQVIAWDRATGKRLRDLSRPDQAFLRCRSLPDGESLLVADRVKRGRLVRVDARTGTELRTFECADDSVSFLTVAPTGRAAAVLTSRRLAVCETLTGKERWAADLEPFAAAATFSPDGRLLVTGGKSGVARVWDAVTGRSLGRLEGHNGDVGSVDFAPDGRRLVTAGWNMALVWDVAAVLKKADPGPAAPAAADLAGLWDGLGEPAAWRAARALSGLARGGDGAIALLTERLAEPSPVPADRIDGWVADLMGPNDKDRERAAAELEKAGGLAEAALRKALLAPAPADAAERIKALLAKIDGVPAAWVRAHRGVEVLELIGDRPARDALRKLAKDAADPSVRADAGAAVRRLERR